MSQQTEKHFPTFRRLLTRRLPLPSLRPLRTTSTQQQALLRMLTLAVEQHLPLVPWLTALARDERGAQRRRLRRLVRLLESGAELPDAVEQVPDALSAEGVLAVRFGTQSGTLAQTLRSLSDVAAETPRDARVQLRRTAYYLATVAAICGLIVTFLLIKIFPTWNAIFNDMGTSPPWIFQQLGYLGGFWARHGLAILLVALLLGWTLASGWWGRSLRSGWLARWLRPLSALRSADVLRNLGVVTAAGRPVPAALSTLARYHYDPTIRQGLLFVRNEVEQGADPWESMQQVRLITAAEADVLQAAGRVGNRPWALKQVAKKKRGHVLNRLAVAAEAVRPVLLIVWGLGVLFVALAVFLPLVSLIQNLT
jgi:type II secretory pathway component PulF